VVATIGIVQAALGVREILGVYKPHAEWTPLVRGTFVNPNHFGALMCLGGPCALLLALRDRGLRPYAFAATFIIAMAVVLTVERASVIAALLGNVVVFAIDWVQLRRGSEALRPRVMLRVLLALAVVAGVGVAVGFGARRLEPEVDKTVRLHDLEDPLSKIRVWERSADLVWSYPFTGIGRGAFPQVFARVSSVGGYTIYEWAENAYVQAVVDWGVPVALLLFLLGGWAALLALRRLREDPLALGPLAALFALAVHEAADFAIETPGVALPALAFLACLFGQRSPGNGGDGAATRPATRAIKVRKIYLFLPLVLFLPFLAELRTPSAAEDAATITRLARDPAVSTDRLLAFADGARLRHPADSFLCLLVAERLVRELHPQSLRWLNEAMYLNPTHWAPHLMAAEVLAATRNKSQALLEYRLAAAGAPDPRAAVWERVLARYPDVGDLLAATPDDAVHLGMLAKWLLSKGRSVDAERVYARVVEHEPRQTAALAALARLAIARGDAAAAHRWVTALLELNRGPDAQRLEIEERVLAGDLATAQTLLDGGLQPPRAQFDLEILVSRALARAGRTDEARSRLDRLLTVGAGREARIQLFEARADVERMAGNERQYLWEIEQRDRLQLEAR